MNKITEEATKLGLHRKYEGKDIFSLHTETHSTQITKNDKGGHIQHHIKVAGYSDFPVFIKGYKSDAGFYKGLKKLSTYLNEG